jgi:hypothetical protein
MARGRHRRRSGLLSRRLPRRRRVVAPQPSVRAELERLESELQRQRGLAATTAQTAAAALVRAGRAEDLAALAVSRAAAAEQELSTAHGELAGLRADLASLREELVWAFAERRLPIEAPAPSASSAAVVVDLRESTPRTA